MNAGAVLPLLKWASIACCATAVGVASRVLAVDPDSLGHRAWAQYCGGIERKLYRMFVFRPGYQVALGQLGALCFVALVAASTRAVPWIALGMMAILAVIGPSLWLSVKLRQRITQIDRQVDGFLVAMANALKSRPALGDAVESVVGLTPNPLRQELELAVKQMRVGSTIEQALLHMSARVGSKQLDTGMTAMLIGRQVGGNLPPILETTAATMREMARLEGIVRTKTAEGKAQIWVLALFPLALMLGFNAASPGYFDPLTSSVVGYIVTIIAFALWGASIVVARKILSVDI